MKEKIFRTTSKNAIKLKQFSGIEIGKMILKNINKVPSIEKKNFQKSVLLEEKDIILLKRIAKNKNLSLNELINKSLEIELGEE